MSECVRACVRVSIYERERKIVTPPRCYCLSCCHASLQRFVLVAFINVKGRHTNHRRQRKQSTRSATVAASQSTLPAAVEPTGKAGSGDLSCDHGPAIADAVAAQDRAAIRTMLTARPPFPVKGSN